jgi:RNA polymerase sigma factor (sigma-70 family)
MMDQNLKTQWDTYYPKVYGYFFRRIDLKDDVEDVTSIVMTKFLSALYTKNLENPHAYLWQIARNQLAYYIKNKSKHPLSSQLEENHYTLISSIENYRSDHYQSKVDDIMECVKRNLRGEEFTIMQEVVMFDRTSAEVANELRLKADNVRQKLSRSIKKLRQACIDLWQVHTH